MSADAPKAPAWLAVIVFVTAFGLYANSIPNGFAFDDRWIIERNPRVHGLDRIHRIWTGGYWGEEKVTRYYRPLTLTTYAANFSVHGLRPAGYHLVNVILHAFVSVLVLVLAVRIGLPRGGALLAGLAFAAHPIHTEAVAGVVGRAELLAALAFIGGVLAWLRYRESGRTRYLLGLVLVYGAGLLCKEHVAVLPAVLVAGELALHRLRDRTGRARLLAALLGCGGALSVGLALRFLGTGSFVEDRLLGFRGYPGLLFGESVWIRMLTALKVLERIARLLVFPIVLSPDYSFNQLPIPRGLERGVVMGALLALAGAWWLWRVRSAPARLTMGVWALVAYLPVSNLFFPTTLLLGERTLYLSTVAIVILLGTLFPAAQRLSGRRQRIAAGLLMSLVLALWGVRTIHRNLDWRDQATLFAAAARTSPNSARVRMNHGVELLRAGKAEEAVRELQAAVWILPGYAHAHFNLSRAYESLDRLSDAQGAALRAILLRPDEVRSRLQLGIILLRKGRLEAAREVYRRALRMDPGSTEARSRLREIEQMTAR
jgi:hypothetical protein